MTIHIEVDATKLGLDRLIIRTQQATLKSVVESGALVESRGKKNAPVVSGNLRRSITMGRPSTEGPGVFTVRGGPSAIYGRRVELGFHGPDSLGRVYDQDGRPYFGPAVSGSRRDANAIFVSNLIDALEV